MRWLAKEEHHHAQPSILDKLAPATKEQLGQLAKVSDEGPTQGGKPYAPRGPLVTLSDGKKLALLQVPLGFVGTIVGSCNSLSLSPSLLSFFFFLHWSLR